MTGISSTSESSPLSGAALLIIEATAVLPEGRITYADVGLWNDQTYAAMSLTLEYPPLVGYADQESIEPCGSESVNRSALAEAEGNSLQPMAWGGRRRHRLRSPSVLR